MEDDVAARRPPSPALGLIKSPNIGSVRRFGAIRFCCASHVVYFVADNITFAKNVIGGDEARERGQEWR